MPSVLPILAILGGILIGTVQRGMPAGKAVQTYSILTIGDGLIAQIPALFISICAGIIVTRVTTGEGPSNVGRDIGTQVLAQPKALLIGAAIALGLGLIPGMPWPVFIVLALVVGGIGFALVRGTRRVVDEKTGSVTEVPAMQAAGTPAPSKKKGEPGDEFVPTVPLLMDVAAPLQQAFDAEVLNEELLKIRRALYFDLGVPFPGIHLRLNDKTGKMERVGGVKYTIKDGIVYDAKNGSVALGYYSAPAEAMESPDLMRPWARLAVQAAVAARSRR